MGIEKEGKKGASGEGKEKGRGQKGEGEGDREPIRSVRHTAFVKTRRPVSGKSPWDCSN